MKSRFSAPEARNQLNKLTRHVARTVTVGPRGRLDAGKPRRIAGVARERSTDLPSGPFPGVGRAASSLMPQAGRAASDVTGAQVCAGTDHGPCPVQERGWLSQKPQRSRSPEDQSSVGRLGV